MFNDVYDTVMPHLEQQRQELKEHLRKHGDKYDLGVYQNGEKFPNS
jgi:hypothetical protein